MKIPLPLSAPACWQHPESIAALMKVLEGERGGAESMKRFWQAARENLPLPVFFARFENPARVWVSARWETQHRMSLLFLIRIFYHQAGNYFEARSRRLRAKAALL